MTFQEYQIKAGRTNAVLNKQVCLNGQIQEKISENLHMVLGMVTESAELADVFKKNLAYGKIIDWVNIKEEIGDLMWYIANFCTINNLDMDEILDINIKKLETRYPEKFTEHNAIHRNLSAERNTLEQFNDYNDGAGY